MSESINVVMPASEPRIHVTGGVLVNATGIAPIADAEPELEPDETGAAPAFDPSAYETDVPKVDGIYADKIIIGFTGSVELDIGNEDDLATFNALTLGRDVIFRIGGVVADRTSPLKEDKEGSQSMVRKAKIAVQTVYLPSPEEL